jgi:Precorrin-2 methylase
MEESNPVYIVSLGPGEAGLVSVEGSGALCRADVIFCPKTDMRSRSSVLLKKMKIREEVVRHYALPMNKNREMAYEAYDKVFEESVRLRSEGLCVAIVAEGDAGFYSSTGYLAGKMRTAGIAFRQIAGVPAFIAAAASVGLPVVEQEERLTVCPGKVDRELFGRVAAGGEVAVVMKLSQCEKEIKRLIASEGRLVCHYFENVGADGEYYTCDRKDILAREFPYFSLMIIKGR